MFLKLKKNPTPGVSNSSKDENWVLFDYTIFFGTFCLMRIALAKELWYRVLKNNNKQFKIFTITIEEDRDDSTLKLYGLTILGLVIEVGFT